MMAETQNNMTEMLCPQSMQPTDQLDITIHSVKNFLGTRRRRRAKHSDLILVDFSDKLSPECFAPTPD